MFGPLFGSFLLGRFFWLVSMFKYYPRQWVKSSIHVFRDVFPIRTDCVTNFLSVTNFLNVVEGASVDCLYFCCLPIVPTGHNYRCSPELRRDSDCAT